MVNLVLETDEITHFRLNDVQKTVYIFSIYQILFLFFVASHTFDLLFLDLPTYCLLSFNRLLYEFGCVVTLYIPDITGSCLSSTQYEKTIASCLHSRHD